MGYIGLLPDLREWFGGPASFQRKIAAGLSSRGLRVRYELQHAGLDALLLINATRHLPFVLRARRRGVPVIQRLGAPFSSFTPGRLDLAVRVKARLAMRNMVYTRAHLASRVVYQSHFVESCWNRIHGAIRKPGKIIHNGVDLAHFSPEGPKYTSRADVCIVSVEGTQPGPDGHPALLLAQSLIAQGLDVELMVFGKPLADTRELWEAYPFVSFRGLMPNHELPFFFRGSTFYVLTDIVSAGCPNSVVEALACGTPVIGYQLGVLPEILDSLGGRCVPAEGDPWKGEPPGNVDGLVEAALEIIDDNAGFRANARKLAESRYSLDHMVDEYVDFLLQERSCCAQGGARA
jgi:glycosyltransferase involved in cell wall biosynthesis